MVRYDNDLEIKNYKNQDLKTERVLLRSVLNVSTDEQGTVIDSTRLYESLPVIIDIAKKAKNLVIAGHLGRPEKKERKFSFWHVFEILQKELQKENLTIELIENLDQENIDKINANNQTGKVFLLENIRFFKGEESKDQTEREELINKLSLIASIFINDAFADYRESVSTFYIAKKMKSYLGSSIIKEASSLNYFNSPDKPFISVLGGAKLSEKLDALNALVKISDKVIVGGAMAYTLMKAQGISIGNSLFEADKLEVAKDIVANYSDKLILPVDHLVTDKFDKNSEASYISNQNIPEGKIAIDIGEQTIKKFNQTISEAKSILWNGPMGVFEWPQSEKGTVEILKAITSNKNAYKLAGGGDSISAINKFKLSDFNHISTGGGAMLAFIAYEKFPTIDAILG